MATNQKQVNYRLGALKRKFGLSGNLEPGALIQKSKEKPVEDITSNSDNLSKQEVAIRGLV